MHDGNVGNFIEAVTFTRFIQKRHKNLKWVASWPGILTER